MAVANAKVTIGGTLVPKNFDGIDNTQSLQEVYGTIAVDASPATYATGGIPLVNANNVALDAWSQEPIKATPPAGATKQQPLIVYIESLSGSGFIYGWNRSTNKLQIFTSNGAAPAALAEFTNAAAIPAGVSGDAIFVEAKFLRV